MSPWIESIVTGANAPALGEVEVAGTPVKLTDKRHWISFDVTQLVRDWADGTFENNGLALVPQFTLGVGGIVASFDSKENAASSHEPMLDIVLVGNGAAGPQGVAGPKGETGPIGPRATPARKAMSVSGRRGSRPDWAASGIPGNVGPVGPQLGPQGIRSAPKVDVGPDWPERARRERKATPGGRRSAGTRWTGRARRGRSGADRGER